MNNFIKTQYRLYLLGQNSISIEKIKHLANIFLTEEERNELFKEQ